MSGNRQHGRYSRSSWSSSSSSPWSASSRPAGAARGKAHLNEWGLGGPRLRHVSSRGSGFGGGRLSLRLALHVHRRARGCGRSGSIGFLRGLSLHRPQHRSFRSLTTIHIFCRSVIPDIFRLPRSSAQLGHTRPTFIRGKVTLTGACALAWPFTASWRYCRTIARCRLVRHPGGSSTRHGVQCQAPTNTYRQGPALSSPFTVGAAVLPRTSPGLRRARRASRSSRTRSSTCSSSWPCSTSRTRLGGWGHIFGRVSGALRRRSTR